MKTGGAGDWSPHMCMRAYVSFSSITLPRPHPTPQALSRLSDSRDGKHQKGDREKKRERERERERERVRLLCVFATISAYLLP